MTVIACLQLPSERNSVKPGIAGMSDDAVLDLCAQLTPVVEPDGDRIWMDWTGCGAVPELAEKLAAGLARLTGVNAGTNANGPAASSRRRGYTDGPAASSRRREHTGGPAESPPRRARYGLGVAPLRFVAGALAAGAGAGHAAAKAADILTDTPVVGGFRVEGDALPEALASLRIRALPGIDAEVQEALQALDVRTLGELARFPRDLLHGHVGPVADRLLDWARGRDERRVRALYPPERLERRIAAEALGLAGGLHHDLFGDVSGGGPAGGFSGAAAAVDVFRLKAVVFGVAEELAAELAASRRACAAVTVAVGGRRLDRSFTSPVTAPDRLGRIILHMLQRLLAGPSPGDHAANGAHRAPGDCIITITPARHEGRQTTLFDLDRLGAPAARPKPSALDHPALAAVRARFGHLFRFNVHADAPDVLAGGAGRPAPGGRGESARSAWQSEARGDARRGGAEPDPWSGAVAHYEAMCRFYA